VLLRPVLMPILRNPLQGIADGIRNMLAELLGSSQFFAPLTHSLVLARGTGSPTFTRATTKTVENNDGYLVTLASGEIGFPGARRVRNLISTSSEDIPNYGNNNTTVSASSEAISGVVSTYDIYETAATGIHTRNRLFPALAGHKYVCSVRAKAGTLRRVMIRDGAVTGAASTFDLVDGVVVADEAGGVGSIESTEDAGVYLLSMTFTAPSDGNYSPYVYLMRDGTAGIGSASYAGDITKYLTVGGVQVEDVTVQTAGEYVSVGVPSDWAGDELVTNGAFDSATTGWTAMSASVLSVVGGKLRITNGAVAFGGAQQAIQTVVGQKYVVSREFAAGTIATAVLYVGSTSGAADLYVEDGNAITPRIAEFTATTTTTYIQVYVGDTANGGYADFDNISVKPAYYHGSFVDGVKCFPTDLSGNPIPAATLIGYQVEGARTNLCLQSNAFTATWSASGTPTPTQNVVGPDGATSAWTLTDNNAASIEGVGQTIALTAATYTYSIFVKKTTGAQSSYPVITADNGASRIAACTVDTTNGVATVWTAYTSLTVQTSSASCVFHDANYWRVSLTFLATAENWVHYLLAAATANATQSTGTFDVTAQGSAVFYGAQVELGSFASSYIATTTAAVTRAADADATPTASNILAAASTVYLEFTPDHTPSGTIALWGTYVDASNYTAILHDATNMIMRKRIAGVNYDATIANAFSANTTYKVCGSWGASGATVTVDGTEGTPHANTTAAQIAATMQWGADGNSLQQPFATERNARVWQRQLSTSERGAITA